MMHSQWAPMQEAPDGSIAIAARGSQQSRRCWTFPDPPVRKASVAQRASCAVTRSGVAFGEDEGRKMAENKTRPTELSVAACIDAVTDQAKRADAKALVKVMQKATGEKPKMWGPSIIGFGSYHYIYESGRQGDMPLAGFSPRKAATVLYGMTGFSESEALLAKLGKHTTGGGCLYIKKLADVDREVLEALL